MQNSADLLVESVALSARAGEHCDIHAMVGAMTVQVVGTTAFGCARAPGSCCTRLPRMRTQRSPSTLLTVWQHCNSPANPMS